MALPTVWAGVWSYCGRGLMKYSGTWLQMSVEKLGISVVNF